MLLSNWILVADGSRARLLQQQTDGQLVVLHEWDSPPARKHPGQLESDRSGQAAPGHTLEHSDPQFRHQRTFARDLAEYLNKHQEEYENLVLIAAPKTLGALRDDLNERVQRKVSLESSRDWTHLPLHELPERIQQLAFP
jgi:protein required for attachment to host cells